MLGGSLEPRGGALPALRWSRLLEKLLTFVEGVHGAATQACWPLWVSVDHGRVAMAFLVFLVSSFLHFTKNFPVTENFSVQRDEYSILAVQH